GRERFTARCTEDTAEQVGADVDDNVGWRGGAERGYDEDCGNECGNRKQQTKPWESHASTPVSPLRRAGGLWMSIARITSQPFAPTVRTITDSCGPPSVLRRSHERSGT